MFTKRLLSGFFLIPIVVFLIWWNSTSFLILVGLVSSIMLLEFYKLSEALFSGAKSDQILRWVALLLVWGFCLSSFSNLIPYGLTLLASIFCPMVYYLLKRQVESALLKIPIFTFGLVYIAWSFALHLLWLRQLESGTKLVLFFVVVIWSGDSGAYFSGVLFGKQKLIEVISPKKTVEGTIGGFCLALTAGIIFQQLMFKETIDLKNAAILSLILSLFAQISDLCESTLKRSVNVKDSGSVIPGHGGLLDRCDSMIFAAPIMYYYATNILSIGRL